MRIIKKTNLLSQTRRKKILDNITLYYWFQGYKYPWGRNKARNNGSPVQLLKCFSAVSGHSLANSDLANEFSKGCRCHHLHKTSHFDHEILYGDSSIKPESAPEDEDGSEQTPPAYGSEQTPSASGCTEKTQIITFYTSDGSRQLYWVDAEQLERIKKVLKWKNRS